MTQISARLYDRITIRLRIAQAALDEVEKCMAQFERGPVGDEEQPDLEPDGNVEPCCGHPDGCEGCPGRDADGPDEVASEIQRLVDAGHMCINAEGVDCEACRLERRTIGEGVLEHGKVSD